MNDEVKVEEPKKLGTKETKEMLALVFSLAKMFKQAKANDGVINVADLALLVNAMPIMGEAFDNVMEIPAELKDLDSEEVKELLVYSAAHLGEAFDSAPLKEKLEKGLEAVLSLLNFYRTFIK